MRKSLLIILLPLLINSCKQKKDIGIENIINTSEKENNSLDLKTKKGKNEILVDSIRIPEFVIQLELSEKAKNKLTNDKESVIVKAYFSGIPKDTLNKDYGKHGKTLIGEHEIELWDSKVASFKNIELSKQTLKGLTNPNFEVLINVYSGRHSSTYNLLDCEILQESIDSIKGKTHLIKGKLLFDE